MSIATANPTSISYTQTPERIIGALGERFDFLGVLGLPGPVKYYRVSDRCSRDHAEDSDAGLVLGVFAVDAELEPARLELFQAQTRAASMLEHPNITRLEESAEANGVHYCLLRFPSKFETLRDVFVRNGWLRIEDNVARSVILQVSDALAHAHLKSILHLSVRPENILIDQSGNAFLTGFGIAQHQISPVLLAEVATQIDRRYVSPELLGGHAVTWRSDLYSLGVTLYEMITDRVPQAVGAGSERRQSRAAIAPHLIMDTISPAVSSLILRMLDDDPENGFRDMRDFQEAAITAVEQVEAVIEPPDWNIDLIDVTGVLVGPEPDPMGVGDQDRNIEEWQVTTVIDPQLRSQSIIQSCPAQVELGAEPVIASKKTPSLPTHVLVDEGEPPIEIPPLDHLRAVESGSEPDNRAEPVPDPRDAIYIPALGPRESCNRRDFRRFGQVEGKTGTSRILFIAMGLIVVVSAAVLMATKRSAGISKTGRPAESEHVLPESANRTGTVPGRTDSIRATTTQPTSVGRTNTQGSLESKAMADRSSVRKLEKRHRRSLPKPYRQSRPRPHRRRSGYY